jgi:hypothetical protein
MLERIEPKQGRVFDTTNMRKEWTKACAALGLAVSSQWKAGRTIRGMKV